MANTVQQRRIPNRRLLELMINQGLSPNDLAAATGVSAGTIRDALKGRAPGPRIQHALASYFGEGPLEIWPLPLQRYGGR
jgi:transcriptional regulator with XRE-family HTH domain